MNRKNIVVGILLCLIYSSVWPMKRINDSSDESREAKREKVSAKIDPQDTLVPAVGLKNVPSAVQEMVERIDQQLLALSKGRDLAPFISCLGQGADVNSRDTSTNGTALHYACLNNDSAVVRLLLGKGASTDVKDLKGFTPLHIAAMNGHEEICGLLLAHKAPVDARTNRDYIWKNEHFGEFTPLHLAVYGNHLEVVKRLIEKEGADKNARTQDGRTVFDIAVQRGFWQVLSYLQQSNEIHSHPEIFEEASDTILSALEQGNNTKVLQLLEANASTADELRTLFAKAKELNNYHIVGFLVLKGLLPVDAVESLVAKVPLS